MKFVKFQTFRSWLVIKHIAKRGSVVSISLPAIRYRMASRLSLSHKATTAQSRDLNAQTTVPKDKNRGILEFFCSSESKLNEKRWRFSLWMKQIECSGDRH